MVYLTLLQVQEKLGYHPKTLSRWAYEALIKYIKSLRTQALLTVILGTKRRYYD